MKKIHLTLAILFFVCTPALAQVGDLLWEENFDDLDNWLTVTGNGYWGWGNGELEFYKQENVGIAPIPGEAGNTALRIIARQESGPGIVDQWGNPLSYTSGKVVSKSFVTVMYGMIECRVRVPNIDLGGWPAVWLLGSANYAWPRCGEIDMMEMGSKKAFRDLHDTHNGGNGLNNSTVNQSVTANAIYYSAAAVTPANPSGAASLSWDPDDDFCRPYYSYANPLVERFLVYRLYWDDDCLRMTVVDDGVERYLYTSPFAIDSASAEFQAPFYLIANLAIGGAFTDAYQLGDPGSGLPVSMPFPAEMYVDYIRLYEWNGQGEVSLGPPPQEIGTFGIYTDETPTNDGLVPDVSAEIYVWEGTLTDGSLAPYEGDNVLSWQTAGSGWFGAGIMSMQPVNLFGFGDGHLKFRINIPANVTFKIGIIDTWGNQHYVQFPAHQTTYGLVRNGGWGQASIPVSALRGTAIDLRMLSYEFVILEEHGTACLFALDDIYWEGGGSTSVLDEGVVSRRRLDLHPNAPNPFNARTEIRFDLPSAGIYELEIYDVAGRRVAGFGGVGSAGANSLFWDGRDDRGADLGSGVYYYRLRAGADSATREMILLK
ncbi:MAG: T9SS type A sorting domain-containing protein [Candidatus Latescibacteria bacterium]|nr:T9SS type A sorting domain-containing protein [Candidatus Latescibacterota bacterium]